MRHIKTFESYSDAEVVNEEFIGKLIKSIINIPTYAITLIILQFMDPRKIKDMMVPKLIDVYANIDVLIDTLENIHFNKTDITDVESKRILEKLNKLKEVKAKYPTLELYKKQVAKYAKYINIRNRKYLVDQIMQYEPKKMNAREVLRELQTVYKLASKNDVIGDVEQDPQDRPWAERFGRHNF